MATETFKAGTAIKISDTVKDTAGNLITPTTITVTIKRGSDAAVVTNANMAQQSLGVYYYIWQSAAINPTGIYTVTTTVVYAGYTSIKEADDLICLK